MVRDEGYRAACSTLPGVNDRRTISSVETDLYQPSRLHEEFGKKMAGAYDILQRARSSGAACAAER